MGLTKKGQTITNDKDRADLRECLNLICNWASTPDGECLSMLINARWKTIQKQIIT